MSSVFFTMISSPASGRGTGVRPLFSNRRSPVSVVRGASLRYQQGVRILSDVPSDRGLVHARLSTAEYGASAECWFELGLVAIENDHLDHLVAGLPNLKTRVCRVGAAICVPAGMRALYQSTTVLSVSWGSSLIVSNFAPSPVVPFGKTVMTIREANEK